MQIFNKILILAVATLAITGCVNTTEPAPFVESAGTPQQPLSGQIEMTIKDFHHHPNEIIARQGSVLIITNLDDSGQSLISDDKSLNTGVLSQNESAELPLKDLGKFVFSSEPYPNMTGSITVVP